MTKILLSVACLLIIKMGVAQPQPSGLTVENLKNPNSIDAAVPRFSWRMAENTKSDFAQTAYEIVVDTVNQAEGAKGVHYWSTGKVVSDESIFISYNGRALKSAKRYFWRVRVWDQNGKASQWSETASWRMGLLLPADWQGSWIGSPGADSVNGPAILLRTEFRVNKTIREATASITSRGFYEAAINGKKIGNGFLTPGWTSYNKRLQYQTYDVTGLLQSGQNALGVSLGSGWYRSPLGPYTPRPNFYGKELGLLMQIKISYTDGTAQTIASDGNWKSATGALRMAEIYNGCTIDMFLDQKGWLSAGYNEAKWQPVKLLSYTKTNLIATYNEPVTKHESFRPVKIITTPKGEKVIDFGQNLVGWVKVSVKGRAGDSVKIAHAEVLDKAGNFYTENLRAAKATNTYILSDEEQHSFEPQFTWQGFRYIKVEGIKGALNPADFEAIAIYSDMQPTGTFACSDPMLNQLQHNIQWGQKGNFLDVPTDCPQRDERLGWTGDAQVFAHTAAFNMNVHNFFVKWMKDVAADQYKSGSIPFIIPDIFTTNGSEVGGATGWGDVSTIVPWNIYQSYGDIRILKDQYPSMKAWVNHMQKQAKNNLWATGEHFGDWLFYSVNNDRDGSSAITNKYLIAQCFYAHSTQILADAAKLLGNKADAAYYTALVQKIKTAFINEYVTPNGLISSDTQTAYALALQFDMLPENLRQQAADRLAKNVARYENHLTTGFLGTPYLCHVLSRFGYASVAYKLLLQDTYPSWLYPIKKGATTIWERWDGIKTDGTFEESSMNSYNHYSYGAIGDWMYQNIAGIQAALAGYKKIIIKPVIGGNLTWAEATFESPYGLIKSRWQLAGGKLQLHVSIPPNTTAEVFVPNAGGTNYEKKNVNAGAYDFTR
ncbi:alpha-L-rhamnosidase [Mucilaginibacter sp. PAMC 26640]|nr:alpha-L-rhamnosidase [Mucilaginibacter sp. PAMC 26640]